MNIRPLLLPPTSNPSAFPSLLKRIYDPFGILLSIFILNYTTLAPPSSYRFLLSSRDSLTWSRLGWYEHIVAMGSFFGWNPVFHEFTKGERDFTSQPTQPQAAATGSFTQPQAQSGTIRTSPYRYLIPKFNFYVP